MNALLCYAAIWLVDFEFRQPAGDRPAVQCMVAHEYRTGRTIRLWADDLYRMSAPPFPIGPDTLVVAYFASAEVSCFLELGWQTPSRVLDLFTEFRCLTNGRSTTAGNGLLGALAEFGLHAIDGAEKCDMRNLAQRGGPYSADERSALLSYCQSDVEAVGRLLTAMAPKIDLPRALLRGRFMAAVARIERCGVPIDCATLQAIRANWPAMKSALIDAMSRRRIRLALVICGTRFPALVLPIGWCATKFLGPDLSRALSP